MKWIFRRLISDKDSDWVEFQLFLWACVWLAMLLFPLAIIPAPR